jgi:SHS2 domain-containing protein
MKLKKKFEFLEHTADTKIKAYGATLEEAFENVVLATTTVMTQPEKIQETTKKKINVKASNTKALLYDLLEEILFLLDTELFIVKTSKIIIKKNQDNYELTAELAGDYIKKKI